MSVANDSARASDLIVIGGGLAGLTAATLVAGVGRTVVLLEQASHLGGRAATQVRQGIHFNLGAHALYRHGQAFRIFTEFGIPLHGSIPAGGRSFAAQGDRLYALPQGTLSLVTSGLLSLREKWRMARLLGGFARLDARTYDCIPVNDWVATTAGNGNLAQLLLSLFRLTTYGNDPGRMSAGVAIRQLQLALSGNVLYLDGGWQSLIEGLRARAIACGVRIHTGARVQSLSGSQGSFEVRLAGGEVWHAGSVVLAVPPPVAASLLALTSESTASRRMAACIPVRAACLDVALHRLPRPAHRFAIGLDRPLYYSVHSAAAKLAPTGIAVVQLMKYLGDEASPPEVAERELEALLDRLQPGWREHVVVRRYLPAMTVAGDLPRAQEGGLPGRPAVVVRERPGVYLAGDWVGADGLLADASAASGAEAARCVLQRPVPAEVRSERSAAHVHR